VSLRPLRPWERLSLRLAVVFALVTVLAVGLVGGVIYQRQKRDVEDTVGTQLLNIARVASLLVDPGLHAEVQRTRRADSEAYARIRKTLATIQDEVLTTPIYTLTDYDAAARQARFMVTSRGPGAPGEPYPLVPEVAEPLGWSFADGVARYTRAYRNQSGTWISAFAPIVDGTGRTIAVLDVDYAIDIYLDRLRELERSVLLASLAGGLGALLCGLLFARYLTHPISALTAGVGRVAAGDLSRALPVRSRDEIGRLTEAFNQMLDGLRQRDFIRNTFGRYVSPEVAKALLESPEGLRLGGEKHEVTVLMSDLRGYTQFAERGDPARVMDVLNGYLARMAEVVIAHGGTVNEFIGDAVFAIFGAPIAHTDHAERAAAAAIAMQSAMVEINLAHAARGLPRFEMGIGINTGEAVVGNIGSEQRAKYTVVGNAVNVAARVESSTVGGQIFVSAATYEKVRELAEVTGPVPVQVKGVSEPLLLYELRAMGGRFAQRLPETSTDTDPQADVTLPVVCHVIDGKVVRAESVPGTVVRLGPRHLDARVATALAPLTNLKLRLNYPGLGCDSADLYGKVVAWEDPVASGLTRIRLTSVEAADQKAIEAIIAAAR
jgi:class 3 adenylate cyclase